MVYVIFLAIFFFYDDGFRNIFVYQPILNPLELKGDKSADYVIGWKSKGVQISKLIPLYTAFLHSIKLHCQNCKYLNCL